MSVITRRRQSNQRILSNLSGWANKRPKSWISVAEKGGLALEARERDRYIEWAVSRGEDVIGFLHEFPYHPNYKSRFYAFAHVSWPVRWWRRLRKAKA